MIHFKTGVERSEAKSSLILTVPCIRNNHVMHQNMCNYIHIRRSTVHLVDTVVPCTNIHLLENIIITTIEIL